MEGFKARISKPDGHKVKLGNLHETPKLRGENPSPLKQGPLFVNFRFPQGNCGLEKNIHIIPRSLTELYYTATNPQ